ncbi:MAG: galactose oxidase early set domain-containing protein, partial [Bacteroidota bacterium]
EIYTPDYLWRGPRPSFTVNQTEIFNLAFENLILDINLTGEWTMDYIDKDKIGLLRLASFTHSFGFDQRYVALALLPSSKKNQIKVLIPGPNILPPGYYWLFLVSVAGAPSLGQLIHVTDGL